MGVRRVEVEIQELVLHGVARADATAVAASLERELRARLAGTERFGATRSVDRVDARRIAGVMDPTALGAAVADRVHASLHP